MSAEQTDLGPSALGPDWVDRLVKASSDRSGGGRSAVVAVKVDSSPPMVFELDGGRVVATAEEADAAVTIPLTTAQLTGILDGTESLAQGFIRGDVKPVGATGALVAAVELFEDATFRQRLAELA